MPPRADTAVSLAEMVPATPFTAGASTKGSSRSKTPDAAPMAPKISAALTTPPAGPPRATLATTPAAALPAAALRQSRAPVAAPTTQSTPVYTAAIAAHAGTMPYADAANAPDATGATTDAAPYDVRTNDVTIPSKEPVICGARGGGAE